MSIKNSGLMRCKNPHLIYEDDIFFHLGLNTKDHDIHAMFHDIKFVIMGGTETRLRKYTEAIKSHFNYDKIEEFSKVPDRYHLFKTGPVLGVTHGIGAPMVTVILQEVTKLLTYASCSDVTYIRLGTSGGLGCEPGTVIISESCVDGLMKPSVDTYVMGRIEQRPSLFTESLVRELHEIASSLGSIKSAIGKTMSCNDFYECQGRLDGAICTFTPEERKAFLQKAYDIGVRNIEMEGAAFAAFCHHLDIKCAMICVSFVNRLENDKVVETKARQTIFEEYPLKIFIAFMEKCLQ